MFNWLKRDPHSPNNGVAAPSLIQQAQSFQIAKDWLAAEKAFRKALKSEPASADAWFGLGDSLYQQDRLEEARGALEQALRLRADDAEIHYKLGNVLKDIGELQTAKQRYQNTLNLAPDHAQAHNNLGTLWERQGETGQALTHYHAAINSDPTLLPAHQNLATLLSQLERFEESVLAHQNLIALTPDSVAALYNLAQAYRHLGRLPEAAIAYQRALDITPDTGDAMLGLAMVLEKQGRHLDVIPLARRLMALNPESPDGWMFLGNAVRDLGRTKEALAIFRDGLKVAPQHIDLLNNLAALLGREGDLDQAFVYLQQALEHNQNIALPWLNRGNIRLLLGEMAGAISDYRKALEIDPDNVSAARYLLTAILYTPLDMVELFREHVAFHERFATHPPLPQRTGSGRSEKKKIRIAYLSSDFRVHPVAYNIRPIIEHHNREQFEVFLYANAEKSDHLTTWFQKHCTMWRPVTGLTDQGIAQQIQQDEIDILVFLANRFDSNKPLVANYRPCPIQVSMHDPGTSGLWHMDYLIADSFLASKRTEEKFTERVLHLPTFYLHEAIAESPDPSPPPIAQNGYITFGSFNNPAKITPETLSLWARLLAAVPNSKLLLKYWNSFEVRSIKQRYKSIFEAHQVDFSRVITKSSTGEERGSHLARYAQVDIALDPFPFTGSTTTFEALWMGVPVVTLAGKNMAARWSASMLNKIGLDDLVAYDEDNYIAIATRLAENQERLAMLRTQLRERVMDSPLCATIARTRQIERLYRWMWAKHLSNHA